MSCCIESQIPQMESQRVDAERSCLACQGPSYPITLRTMLLMLKPEFFDHIGESQYRCCASPECAVIYFSRERCFTNDDLRIRVGLKEKAASSLLCYCFGFTEQDVRKEIETEGHTTIPERISALIKQRMCACEERNPLGTCCLGEVTRVVKRLIAERG